MTLPTPPHHQQPELIRCKTTADFLAALPRLTGFTAKRSLFIVLFSGARANGAMRIDLPASDAEAELDEYAAEVVRWSLEAMRAHGMSAPALVIESDVGFEASGGMPWRRLAGKLDVAFEAVHMSPRELCCVAPDGWASYFDFASPPLGYPLSMIETSDAHAPEDAPHLDEIGRFHEPSDEARARVARVSVREGDFAHYADRFFRRGPLSAAEIATFRDMLELDVWWSFVFDELAELAFDAHAPREHGARGAPIGGPEQHHVAMEQLTAATEHLAHLVPYLSEERRSTVMALSAIAWWMRGLETVARRQADQALAHDPLCPVALLASEVINNGSFPMTVWPQAPR